MVGAIITVFFVLAALYLAYRRLALIYYSAAFTVLLGLYLYFGEPGGVWAGILWLLLALLWLLNIRPLRKALVSRPFLKGYMRLLPAMSDTEREALEAGTVWWDGELFTGNPDWSKLLREAPATLTDEEKAFLNGPVDELCAMLDDWKRTASMSSSPAR